MYSVHYKRILHHNSQTYSYYHPRVYKKKQTARKNPEDLILDNGMNISIFNDAYLAKNTRKEKDSLMLYTNAGKILVTPINLGTGVGLISMENIVRQT